MIFTGLMLGAGAGFGTFNHDGMNHRDMNHGGMNHCGMNHCGMNDCSAGTKRQKCGNAVRSIIAFAC